MNRRGDFFDLWKPVKKTVGQKQVKEDYIRTVVRVEGRFHEIKSEQKVALGLILQGDHRILTVDLDKLSECEVDWLAVDLSDNSIWRVSMPVLRVKRPIGHWQMTLSQMGNAPVTLKDRYGL